MSILYILLGTLALVAMLLVGLIIATIILARRPPGGPTTTYNVVMPPVLSPVEGPAYPPAHRAGSGRVALPPAIDGDGIILEPMNRVPPHLLHITGPDASLVRVRRQPPRIIGEPDDDDDFRVLPASPADRADMWHDPWAGAGLDGDGDLDLIEQPARRPGPPEDPHVEPAGADHARADRVGSGRVAQAEDPPELVEAARKLSLRQLRLQHGIGYSRARRLKQTYDPTYREDL